MPEGHSILKVKGWASFQGHSKCPDQDREEKIPNYASLIKEKVTDSLGMAPVAPQKCHLSREKAAETETSKTQRIPRACGSNASTLLRSPLKTDSFIARSAVSRQLP